MGEEIKTNGWNWWAFLFGALWYCWKGMWGKGLVLLLISCITLGFAAPIIWIYCGVKGNSDYYKHMRPDKAIRFAGESGE